MNSPTDRSVLAGIATARADVEAPKVDFSVVIPAKNEAENIVNLVRETAAAVGTGNSYEIIVIDDGSSDDTAKLLQALRSESDIPLRVLQHEHSLGQSAALRSGVRAAYGDWIVTMDGDGQNDPKDIPLLLDAMGAPKQQPDLVCGIRAVRKDNLVKRVSSKIANAIRGRLLADGVTDTGCGLKLIRRSTFLELPFFDHLHRFLPALVMANEGLITCVPVSHRPRQAGKSNYGTWDRLVAGLVDLAGVLWLKRRAKSHKRVRELD
jgi:dolichol-phosphate mannosyltransferase